MLIGREEEIKLLKEIVKDDKSHFVAIYGRRRIGKTFLIKETLGENFIFCHTGLANASMKDQIKEFAVSLKKYGYEFKKRPKDWLDAFDGLKELVSRSTVKRKIIFIDELSWMDTQKSNILTAVESFFNGFANYRDDVVLIVCASATSWMLNKIIHNKGGLYNRLTEQIYLTPFNLYECEEYVKKSSLSFTRDQILQYYMAVGGIPYYWSLLKKGYSIPQNIDNIFFKENAPLKNEYYYLYASIFKNPQQYLKIIEALSLKKKGLTRDEIIKNTGIGNTGDLSKKLAELESCGFIKSYKNFNNINKGSIYQLVDLFTLFYFSFLKKNPDDENFWVNQINTPKVNTWLGLSFEKVCLHHIKQIKNKLSILGVISQVNSINIEKDAEKGLLGSQIDILIVRNDKVINMIEIKYSNYEYTLNEDTANSIKRKINDLQIKTGFKYAIYPTLITNAGLIENSHSDIISNVITADDLFCNCN